MKPPDLAEVLAEAMREHWTCDCGDRSEDLDEQFAHIAAMAAVAWRQACTTESESGLADDYRDLRAELVDEKSRLAALEQAVTRVRELHRPYRIYEECECADKSEGHVSALEVGYTCAYLYTICTECCCGGSEYQSEECATYHGHGKDVPFCATVRALDGTVAS